MNATTVNENRKTYVRRSVLHLCAGGALFRAPECTLAKKGEPVYLLSYSMEGEDAPVSALVQVGGEIETWLPWAEGREKGSRESGRKVYVRKGVHHFCGGKGRLYALPSTVKKDSLVELAGEPTDQEATVIAGEEVLTAHRWTEGEKKSA